MVQISHRLSMYKCATGSSAANWTGWIDEVVNIITVAVQLIPQSGTGRQNQLTSLKLAQGQPFSSNHKQALDVAVQLVPIRRNDPARTS